MLKITLMATLLAFLGSCASTPDQYLTRRSTHMTSARDVAFDVMHEVCTQRGVPDASLALDGEDNLYVATLKCYGRQPGGGHTAPLSLDLCEKSDDVMRIRRVIEETPELEIRVKCADPATPGPGFPPAMRAIFDAMAGACNKADSKFIRVQWTASGRWLDGLACERKRDHSVWKYNICESNNTMKALRQLLTNVSKLPVSCNQDIPTEYASQDGSSRCSKLDHDGVRRCY